MDQIEICFGVLLCGVLTTQKFHSFVNASEVIFKFMFHIHCDRGLSNRRGIEGGVE